MQEKLPGAPAVKPDQLGTLRTLRQLCEFLGAGAPSAASTVSGHSGVSGHTAAPAGDVQGVLISVVSDKTGYPAESLNLDMDMESDLGIDSIKRVEILSAMQEKLPGAPTVKPDQLGTLRTLRQVVEFLGAGKSDSPDAKSTVAGNSSPAAESVKSQNRGVSRQVLRALPLSGSRQSYALSKTLPLWVLGSDALLKALKAAGYRAEKPGQAPAKLAGLIIEGPIEASEAFFTAQKAAPALRAAGGLLLTVSRMDGRFGLANLKGKDALQGSLAGLAKTAAREWPEAVCRAIDLDGSYDLLLKELAFSGPVELGLSAEGAFALSLESEPVAAASKPALSKGDLVLVTGGARGVTAATALSLAKKYGVKLALWGRTARAGAEPQWLAACKTEAEIKKGVLANCGDRALGPKQIEEQYKRIAAQRELEGQLMKLKAEGLEFVYDAVDVRDAQAVKAGLAKLGKLDGLVHGAGVLADKLIADKTPEQFAAVWETKLASLDVLLAQDLKAVILFSSTTARLGRIGQGDYAMANEALNKLALRYAAEHPKARVLSVNWGPWEGGMVTPSLQKVFEKEGVALIGLEAGADYLAAELSSPSRDVETVVMGGEPLKSANLRKALSLTASLSELPVLKSHVINGKAVLPAALMIEWLAQGALHENPGLSFLGFEDFRVLKGLKLDARETQTVEVWASKAARSAGEFAVTAELRGAQGVHGSATILLASRLPAAPKAAPEPKLAKYPVEDVYAERLFHGEALRCFPGAIASSKDALAADLSAAPAPRAWIKDPSREDWLSDPLALDGAFQAMILWTTEHLGAPCLPSAARSYRQYRAFPLEGTRLLCAIVKSSAGAVFADLEFRDGQGALIARIEGFEGTVNPGLSVAFRARTVAA
jgi:NAD(P)-dependent dehydrogenase (short-subunit alcohol dehydrogenase family)